MDLQKTANLRLVLAVFLVLLVLLSALPAFDAQPAKVNNRVTTSGTLAIPTYTVSFKQSGVPASVLWTVDLSGYSGLSGNGTYLNETGVANGTFYFYVGQSTSGNYSYIPTPSSGDVTVQGHNITVFVSFYNETVVAPTGKTYGINLTIPNPPAIMPGIIWSWSVTISGVSVPFGPFAYGSTSMTMNLKPSFVNGTYSFTASSAMGTEISPSIGTFTISGRNVNLDFSIILMKHYNVDFYESGLPSSQTFTVSVKDAPTSGSYYSNSNTTAVSSSKFVGFSLFNQTYTFTATDGNPAVYIPEPSTGSVTVSGSNIIVNIAFHVAPATYSVYFKLSNPPAVSPVSGWSWQVYINGTGYSSKNSTLEIPGLLAGTYNFMALGIGIAISTSSGTFTVSSSSVTTVSLSVEPSWEVSFTVTTPSPVSSFPLFSVSIPYPIPGYGSTQISFSSTAGVASMAGLPDGTYTYTLSVHPGSTATLSPTSGTFTINGGNVTIDVSATYLVYDTQFSEQGLLSVPTVQWGVVVDNGYVFNDSSGAVFGMYQIQSTPMYITLMLPQGTYIIQGFIITAAGHFLYQAPQQITVGSGSNLNIVQFNSGTSGTSTASAGLSIVDYGVIGAGVAIAVVGIIAGLMVARRRNSGGSAP